MLAVTLIISRNRGTLRVTFFLDTPAYACHQNFETTASISGLIESRRKTVGARLLVSSRLGADERIEIKHFFWLGFHIVPKQF